MAGMKKILLMIAVVALVGCGPDPSTKEESAKIIEAAIRKELKKPTGELTKSDLEKVTRLSLYNSQLTDVKGLEKLSQLTWLELYSNPDLTLAQIEQLKKALPECLIYSDFE